MNHNHVNINPIGGNGDDCDTKYSLLYLGWINAYIVAIKHWFMLLQT